MSASKTTSQLDAADRRNKLIAVVVGVAMLGFAVYEWQGVNAAPPAPAAAVAPQAAPTTAVTIKPTLAPGTAAGAPAKTIGSTAGALDPTLHMQAMLVTEAVMYTGNGRNIFAGPGQVSDMAPIPVAIAKARTGPVVPVAPVYHPPPGPVGPPPIDLKFFGMVTSSGGGRQAMLLHGDDVFLATKGDIVQRKYRVIDIGPNSIQVEDMSNNNRQTLPLQATP